MLRIRDLVLIGAATQCLVKAASLIHHDDNERALAQIQEDKSALLPMTLAAIPLVVPMATKFALTVAVSGIAYTAMFMTWLFSNGMHSLSRSLDIDDDQSQMNRATRALRSAIGTIEQTITGGTSDCRRRIVCEVSRSMSTAVPVHFQPEGFVTAYLRNQSAHNDTYLGAWASGWLKMDCVDLYTCDRFSVDRVSSVFRSMGGSHGYIAHLVEKYSNLTASFVQSNTVNILTSTEAPAIISHVMSSMLSAASPKAQSGSDDFSNRFGLW